MNQPHPDGQAPLNARNLALVLLVIVIWSSNSVVVKITVNDIPPLWAALFRFVPTLPFIYLFIRRFGSGIKVRAKELAAISILGVIMFSQIYTFNLGAKYTSGGRVTLIIFSYPFIVSLFAPLFLKNERFNKIIPLGAVISLAGLILALQNNISATRPDHFRGDIIELISGVLLSMNVIYNKSLCNWIDKWKVLFWEFITACVLFLVFAVIMEPLNLSAIGAASWQALAYQSIGVSIFVFLGWQYLLARHNSGKITLFFFAGPLSGMILSIIILGEAFDPWLLAGCVLVGAGIYLVNRE